MEESERPAAIKRLRKALGLSHEKLARRLDTSTSTVIRYEKGATVAPAYLIELLERLVADASKTKKKR